MRRAFLFAVVLCVAGPAFAADKIKIGLITTLSGPEAVMGNPMRDSAELALSMLGGKIGGLPAEIVYGDDQQKPDVGRQIAERMLQKDKVDVITGILGSNVLLAIYDQIIRTKTLLLSGNAGPHQMAGEQCSPYFFSVSQQTDQSSESLGKYLNDQHVDGVYIMAPNYNAGKDNLAGFKRFYKGQIVGEVYSAFGQLDYQAEISRIRAAKPKAVFVFLPGGMGIQFVKQYAEAGLKEEIPLYGAAAVDESNLPAEGAAAVGAFGSNFWASTLDNPRNKEYVSAFRARFNYPPSAFGAGVYDTMFLLDGAVKKVHGDLADKKALIAALETAPFQSVRGDFAFNSNHFPIESFYLFEVTAAPSGPPTLKPMGNTFTHQPDSYAAECHMPAE
jgi:branched-chain amino acid transport system substrate-binding protein